MNEVHHGESLEAFLHRKRSNLSALHKKLKISRATLYSLFGKRKIDPEMLALLKQHAGFEPTEIDAAEQDVSKAYLNQNANPMLVKSLYDLIASKDNLIASKDKVINLLEAELEKYREVKKEKKENHRNL